MSKPIYYRAIELDDEAVLAMAKLRAVIMELEAKIAEMRDDASLGRLVRQMKAGWQLSWDFAPNTEMECWFVDMPTGLLAATPEAALREALKEQDDAE